MANAVAVQILEDGPKNVVAKVTIVADTSDVANTTFLDPATLNATFPPTNQLQIDLIDYSVQDGWFVTLSWDATTPVKIWTLAQSDCMDLKAVGGLRNNSTTGKTGKILVSTTGWASGSKGATVLVKCTKQTV